MHTGVSLAPTGPGILPFRHRAFDQDSPPWDLHQRAALLGFEITGRDDDGPTSVGAFKEDVDTRGDLNCANYWQADYQQRPVGCWGFGYASVIKSAGSNPSQNTTGGAGDVTQTNGGNQQQQVLPLGQNGSPDNRFKPKTPIIVQPEGSPGGDPNGGGVNGDNGALGAAGDPGGAGAYTDPNTNIDLGNGWSYQNGVIVNTGGFSTNVDSLSGFNQGRGGYFSGGFTGFQGVGSYFGGSFGATFSGVGSYFGTGGRGLGFSLSGGSR
jgi:hypothetical protein